MRNLTRAQAEHIADDLYAKGHRDTGDLTRALGTALAAAAGPAWVIFAPALAADAVARAQAKAASAVDDIKAVTDLPGVIRDVAETPAKVVKWITDPGSWARIGYVVGGALLVLIGAAMVIVPAVRGPAKATTKIVKKVSG
jgi:hypothetical protein